MSCSAPTLCACAVESIRHQGAAEARPRRASGCGNLLWCYAADVSVCTGEHPLNCLELSADENTLYAGDTLGNIACFDLRAAGMCITHTAT